MIFAIALILGAIALWYFVKPADAIFIPKVDICHCESNECETLHIAVPGAVAHLQQHDQDYAGVCQEPEVTPTPTPTEEPDPCIPVDLPYVMAKDDVLCEEPEVTPTPEVEQVVPPAPAPPVTYPEVCSAPVPADPQNVLVWRNGDQAIVQWVPSIEVGQAIVSWKEASQSGWQHSLTTVNNGYVVINGLGTMDFTFGVAQFNGCVPSKVIEVVDGMPTGWTMFTP